MGCTSSKQTGEQAGAPAKGSGAKVRPLAAAPPGPAASAVLLDCVARPGPRPLLFWGRSSRRSCQGSCELQATPQPGTARGGWVEAKRRTPGRTPSFSGAAAAAATSGATASTVHPSPPLFSSAGRPRGTGEAALRLHACAGHRAGQAAQREGLPAPRGARAPRGGGAGHPMCRFSPPPESRRPRAAAARTPCRT